MQVSPQDYGSADEVLEPQYAVSGLAAGAVAPGSYVPEGWNTAPAVRQALDFTVMQLTPDFAKTQLIKKADSECCWGSKAAKEMIVNSIIPQNGSPPSQQANTR